MKEIDVRVEEAPIRTEIKEEVDVICMEIMEEADVTGSGPVTIVRAGGKEHGRVGHHARSAVPRTRDRVSRVRRNFSFKGICSHPHRRWICIGMGAHHPMSPIPQKNLAAPILLPKAH